ncbi:MAG: methyltransferase domain-containing protein [Deltaproteobacteria bacterium]|jgi:SAM-dependent methyltransferase
MSKAVWSKLKECVKSRFIGTQHEWESHIDNIFQIFNKNLKGYSPNNIIDVGCGYGYRTLRIAEYFGIDKSNVYGVDKDEECITPCQNVFNTQKVDLEVESIPLFGIQPRCIAIDSSHVRAFTHRDFARMLNSHQELKLVDFEGALMYPLPVFLAKTLARYFVGLTGYVCYLMQKI